MNELKRCPFCGGEAELKRYECGDWQIICYHKVGCIMREDLENGYFEDADLQTIIRAWNSRAERTCIREKRGVKMDGSPRLRCSLCGYGIGDKRFNYCPNCGARIEVEE